MADSNLKMHIRAVHSLAELDRLGVKYEAAGESEVRFLCPAHTDSNPSAYLNIDKNLWHCQAASCNAKGDIAHLLALIEKKSRAEVLSDLQTRYDLKIVKAINPSLVEDYHKKVWESGWFLQELYKRGLTDEMIRRARIGFNNGRLTIPVYDTQSRIINVRSYMPGAPGPEKMRNTKGYGKPAIYQVDQLCYDTVWICGGELKAIVAKSVLEQMSVGAVAITAAEGAWEESFTHQFKGKTVYVCFDIDEGGLKGSKRVAGYLYSTAKTVKIIHLPLDKELHPKGDINDWVADGATDRDFLGAMDDAELWVPPQFVDVDSNDAEAVKVHLSDSSKAEFLGRKIEVDAVCSAVDDTPYLVPKEVGVSCSKDQPNCAWCPVKPLDPNPDTGYVNLTIKGTNAGILNMVRASTKSQDSAIKEALKIPTCKVVKFHVKNHHNVLDVRLTPQLEVGNHTTKNILQPAYVVAHSIELNSPYSFKGRVFPSPASQQAVLLLDEAHTSKDSLSAYKPKIEQLESLKQFQPNQWNTRALQTKLNAIYGDLESNVTHIYHRRNLHLLIDLTYHSCLYISFDGRTHKGWINTLIVGDSSQGKTETSLRLMEHYGLGERVDCKNASVAGLLGGLQQLANRWFVSWGVIPTHDRRLVFLEEIKGAKPEVLSKLTDMRSTGIAEIPKIEKRRTNARTRLIFISNSRSGRPVSAYNFGVETIKELFDGLEDIRRFDAALILSSAQINPKEINLSSASRVPKTHWVTEELSRQLLLWSWTRTPENVKFVEHTVDKILKVSTELSETFSESLPLIDRGTIRYKIARLSAALACRTFSTDDDLKCVRVRDCHVEYVTNFLTKIYSDPVCGYLSYSEAQTYANNLSDPEIVRRNLLATKYPRDLVQSLLSAETVNHADFCDWCEVDKDQAQSMVSFLVRKRAIYREDRSYIKTSGFIELLKRLEKEGIPQSATPLEKDEM